MPQKIIYDCDNTLGLPLKEVDDGLTLLYLLGIPEIELLGVTATFGNGTIEQVTSQTLKLINQLKVNLPIFEGEGHRGQDPDTPAAHFMVEMVDQCPGEITLLATGPVGNLRAAALLDPEFFQKVQRIVCMGGYRQPLRLGYRNLHELNFSADPEAALSIMKAPCPFIVFPGSACLDAPYRLKDIWSADYWSIKLKIILTQWLLAFGAFCGVSEFYLWDLLPAVFLTEPDLFDLTNVPIQSKLDDMKNGMLIEGDDPNLPVVTIGKGIADPQNFFSHIESAWRLSLKKHPI